MHSKIAFIALIIILLLVNWSITNKEQQLATGRIVYLQLAPVDPRSLMQGDYMRLRFDITSKIVKDMAPETKDAFVIVTLDDKKVASYKGIYSNEKSLADNEMALQFRVRQKTVKFATNSFFFQEGRAGEFNSARFAQFRVNDKGELLLVAMFNKHLIKI